MIQALRKQITNVHNEAFKDVEYRRSFVVTIMDNLVEGCSVIVLRLEVDLAGTPEEARYKAFSARIKQEVSNARLGDYMNHAFAALVNELRADENFTRTLREKSKELHVQDCFFVFFEKIKNYPVWGGKDWIPSVDECVRARTRTSGVVKELCVLNDTNFCIIDVGGQRAERRKWLHVFEDVTAAIFVAALSDYDQVLFEDSSKNRMQEALDLFSECVNSQWLYDTPTLLFLNKMDIFKRKYAQEQIPLNISGLFPSAPEGNDDIEEALKWISTQFLQRRTKFRRTGQGSKPVGETYVHYTTATDPDNVKTVFQISVNVILRENLKRAGFT